jgi:Phytanoyl-CoA dioxygenase (PhyH)
VVDGLSDLDVARRLHQGERDLVEARHVAALNMISVATQGHERVRDTRVHAVPVSHPDEHPYPPSVPHHELSAETIATAVSSSGCLLARGLLDSTLSDALVDAIDRTFDACDDWLRATAEPASGPWFQPFKPEERSVHMTRPALRAGGGVFTADSPRVFTLWTELIRRTGLFETIENVFGEPPVTALTKGTLRRVTAGDGIEWHQDGAFLGIDSGAINVWVSLSDTSHSPGLDIVGRRFEEIVRTGTHGAGYDWSVGDGLIAELAAESPVVRPLFAPGDALIFDGMLLHRTAQEPPALPGTRYAIETWFFLPSRFPEHQQVPLAF